MSYDIEFHRHKKRPREISLVPMINVIFLMLIFFVVSGRIEKVEILPVEVPLSEQTGDVAPGEAVITLGRHDEILVGETLMFDPEQLGNWAASQLEENPAIRFTIKADARMQATKLITIMKVLEDVGAPDVVLAAEQP